MPRWMLFALGVITGVILASLALWIARMPTGQPVVLSTPGPVSTPWVVSQSERAPAEAEATSTVPAGPVDLNTANEEELDTLPGIGPAIAERIVLYRSENGPFAQVDDLLEVRGIGPALMEQIRPMVTVGGQP